MRYILLYSSEYVTMFLCMRFEVIYIICPCNLIFLPFLFQSARPKTIAFEEKLHCSTLAGLCG